MDETEKMPQGILERARSLYARKGPWKLLCAITRHIWVALIENPVRSIAHYYYQATRKPRIPSFQFQGKTYDYIYSLYNFTYRNERIVEVPIAHAAAASAQPEEVLEVGNVLANYYSDAHDIVDKYEGGPHVINADIETFAPAKPYKIIVSVSTMEHVGWDFPEKKDRIKIPRAINHLKEILAPGGTLLITMPVGYNTFVDEMYAMGGLNIEGFFMKRMTRKNEWKEVPYEEVRGTRYDYPFSAANAIFVGIYKKV